MNPKRIIVDSSVAVKWYLPDESDDNALKIKSDFAKGVILISVPLLFFYEINNILRTTTKSLRITKEASVKAYQDLLKLNFTNYSSRELFKLALEKALVLDITSYDASYVVLAEYLQTPFFTADEKLVKKASSSLVKVLDEYGVDPKTEKL